MKITVSLLLAGFLAGCAAGSGSNDADTAQIRQNNQINQTYGPLVGTYSGKVTNTDHGDENVQLVIYVTTEASTNPDGTTGSRAVPRAYFKRLNPVVAYYPLLAAGYTPQSGVLSLVQDKNNNSTSSSSDSSTQPLMQSINAAVAGQHITGSVQMSSGTLGNLDVTFSSASTVETDDYNQVLLQAYQAVQGTYTGSIVNGNKKTPVIVELSAIMNGGTPALTGFYKRPDVPSGVIDLSLVVNYMPDQYPAQITMNGNGGGQYQIAINGTLSNGTIQASFNTVFQGFLGTLVLNKTSNTP